MNKVSSKIELYFDVKNSSVLSTEQKQLLLEKLGNRINQEGILMIQSQEERSQYRNKGLSIKKFDELVRKAFAKKKKRIKTAPSAATHARRLESKKKHSEKKLFRQKKGWDD